MSRQRSPFTQRRYPLTMVCATYRVARATVYAQAAPTSAPAQAKRGPKTAVSDAVLAKGIARCACVSGGSGIASDATASCA